VPADFQLPVKDVEPNVALPENFDSREQWPACESIKEVRDQSTCGSCWAFGAAEAMSDRLCIASGQKDQTRVSTEDLLSCCGFTCGFGCNGGFPSGAWSFFKNKGLVTGNEFNNHKWCRAYSFAPCEHHTSGQYQPCGESQPTPKCNQACHGESAREYNKDKIHAKDSFSLPNNVAKIQTEIFTNGPIEVPSIN
jgi:cathepsin B